MDQLKQRLDRLENTVDYLAQEGGKRAQVLTDRITHLEEVAAASRERQESFNASIGNLQSHLYRMENSLLQEFKISQEIMKTMLDHDMSIEKAKFDLKMEMERKQQEFAAKQKEQELAFKQERREFRKQLYIKLGTIGLPIITALATGIAYALENFFK